MRLRNPTIQCTWTAVADLDSTYLEMLRRYFAGSQLLPARKRLPTALPTAHGSRA